MIWLGKIDQNRNFWFLTQNRGRLGVFDVQFLKILKIKSKILLYQDLTKVERDKVKKFQQFWNNLQGATGILLRSGPPRPPPVPDRVKVVQIECVDIIMEFYTFD